MKLTVNIDGPTEAILIDGLKTVMNSFAGSTEVDTTLSANTVEAVTTVLTGTGIGAEYTFNWQLSRTKEEAMANKERILEVGLGPLEDQIKYYIDNKYPVSIYHNNEAGEWLWSICVDDTDFWLNSFKTKRDALAYCQKNKIPVTKVYNAELTHK